MFKLSISGIEELYDDINILMNDIFGLFPEASFSSWNDSATEIWQDVYESHDNSNKIGKIFEMND